MQLNTPFGPVVIMVDDIATSYSIEKKEIKDIYRNVLGAYKIMVDKIPDGRSHEIKCLIPDIKFIFREPESGEDIECQAFYSEKGEKISICLRCESGFFHDGSRVSNKYDYDACYLENGMSYVTFKNTRESSWVFGVAWIDDAMDGEGNIDGNRDAQTWLAADVTVN